MAWPYRPAPLATCARPSARLRSRAGCCAGRCPDFGRLCCGTTRRRVKKRLAGMPSARSRSSASCHEGRPMPVRICDQWAGEIPSRFAKALWDSLRPRSAFRMSRSSRFTICELFTLCERLQAVNLHFANSFYGNDLRRSRVCCGFHGRQSSPDSGARSCAGDRTAHSTVATGEDRQKIAAVGHGGSEGPTEFHVADGGQSAGILR